MLRFIGGAVLILGLVSGGLWLTGYWQGKFDLTVTEKGKQTLSDVGKSGQAALTSGLDSLQKSVADGLDSAKKSAQSTRDNAGEKGEGEE